MNHRVTNKHSLQAECNNYYLAIHPFILSFLETVRQLYIYLILIQLVELRDKQTHERMDGQTEKNYVCGL